MLLRYTLQAELLKSKLSSFLRKVKFRDLKFAASTPISNIKYNHPKFQKITLFISFMINLTMD